MLWYFLEWSIGPIGNLSKGVFERRMSTGSEDFSILMWRCHICAVTVFSLNELAHERKKSTCDWRTSLKNAFAQDSVFVNQHNQNLRFEFPTTSGSEWISISRSSQTNTTTSWGKSKLFENFCPVPRTYRELRVVNGSAFPEDPKQTRQPREVNPNFSKIFALFLELTGSWGESKNDSKGKVDGWRRSMYLLVALSLNKKK